MIYYIANIAKHYCITLKQFSDIIIVKLAICYHTYIYLNHIVRVNMFYTSDVINIGMFYTHSAL